MENKLRIDTPEAYLRRFLDFFKINGSSKPALGALFTGLISAFLAYHLLVIYGHGNADAVCEGLVCYGAGAGDWALACGRWLTRYMNALSGNLIMPGVWITLYTLCAVMSAVLLSKLWGIKSAASVSLVSALLIVNPTVIEQSLLQYMFMAWGLSNLFGVLFVCINCGGSKRALVFAPLCMTAAFGLYQSSVGLMCLCFCITLILRLTDGMDIKGMFLLVFRFAVTSIIGVALYFLILRFEIVRYGVMESGRMQDFSLSAIFTSLIPSVKDAYLTFFAYFAEAVLRRKLWYALLAGILCVFFALRLCAMIKERRVLPFVFALALFLLIPAFANIAKLIFPYNTTVTIMEYQNMFVFPFLFALLERGRVHMPSARNLTRLCAYALALTISWTYLVSANATYRSYELTYRHLNFMTASMLNDIYNLPDYEKDDTIAFAGFVQDDFLRENFSSYKYACGMYDNLAFWVEPLGIRNSRENYLMNYFGVQGGFIFAPDYNKAVQSEEFKAMPVYPGVGSVRKFSGEVTDLIIVKLSENPPVF